MSNSAERLEKLVGFDPVKRTPATRELFEEVVSDIRKEREQKAKEAAREQLVKAFELREKMHKVKKECDAQCAKFDKELGKLLSRLESGLSGAPAPAEDDQSEE